MNELRQLLENKYGKEIVTELMTIENRVNLENEKGYGEGQIPVNDHMVKLSKQDLIDFNVFSSNKEWAFDFPGWIGEFNSTGRKVMIIGLEPHIQNNDFQITYSFGGDKGDVFNSNHFIWNRLHSLLFSELTFQEAVKKIYITDLCHFTPKGDAKRIKKIPTWSKIRNKIADKYLKEEINIVNPEIIIAQGGDVFRFLKSRLKIKNKTHWIPTGYKKPAKYGIYTGTYDGRTVFGIPHIGSEHNLTYNFWERKIESVKKIIKSELENNKTG
ncbi:MAG: hypothetical protein C7N36_14790 [Bacteroidetes bacterium]|nr:MAG: hypothetical protein C7N36_14790 [Bacteroidota bacterium]